MTIPIEHVSGSIRVLVDTTGNYEIGTTHQGGLVREDPNLRAVVERADICDLVTAVMATIGASASFKVKREMLTVIAKWISGMAAAAPPSLTSSRYVPEIPNVSVDACMVRVEQDSADISYFLWPEDEALGFAARLISSAVVALDNEDAERAAKASPKPDERKQP